LSEDPVFGDPMRPTSLHAFGYANGNPLLFVDPLGEASRKIYFRQEIEGLPREAKEAALARIDPVLAKAGYLDMSRFTDEQLVNSICANLDAACDESGAEWLWEQGRRKFGPGLQAFADRVGESPAADAVRAIRAKAGEIDESLRDTATGTYRQALGPTAEAIASSKMRPADAAPQVLAQTQAMSRKLGDATVDSAEDLGRAGVERYLLGAVIKVPGLAAEVKTARAEAKVVAGEAAKRAEHELYKDSLRAVMQKPHVTDAQLKSVMDSLYREGAMVGSGSTAAAVREEMTTGMRVGNRRHTQKAQDSIRRLERWLAANPTARPGDRAAAENVIRDMKNALEGR